MSLHQIPPYIYTKKTRKRQFTVETTTDGNYADDLALLENIAKSMLHRLEQNARDTDLYENSDRTKFMYPRSGVTWMVSGLH